MKLRALILTAIAASLLGACAQQPQEPEASPPGSQSAPDTAPASGEAPEPAPEPSPPKTRAFTSDTLYALLAAEMAGNRQQFDVALSNYIQQAHQTRDPQVAARATHIARFLNADQVLLDAAMLWVDIVPDDTEAQLNAAVALVSTGRLQEAFELSRRLHEKDEHSLFQNIAASATEATDTQREQLLVGYRELLEKTPRHRELLIGTGLLLQQQGQLKEAQEYSARARRHHPHSTAAVLLEATILNQLNQSDRALQVVVEALEENPGSMRLRLQYARLLTQHDLGLAQEQFEVLVGREPGDPDLLLSLGIVALERGDLSTAQDSFESLVDMGAHVSSSQYYLGQLAEDQDRLDDALLHYLQVEPGSDFLQATLNILDILLERAEVEAADDHMERLRSRFPDRAPDLYLLQARTLLQEGFTSEAEEVLHRALDAHPEHSDLRYTRAMLYDQQDNLEATEADLRTILKYDPNNATALNALGYILTDQTDRHEEAYDLIEQALALKPDEPAIMDSMGWVLYNLGRTEEALPYLKDAYAEFPDPEVAAHLGEVYWQLGEQDKARQVWQEGLERDPDDQLIPDTMERLGVEP